MLDFEKRIKRYQKYQRIEIPSPKLKKASPEQIVDAETEQQLKNIQPNDFLILLDEKGQTFTSREFASQVQKWMNRGPQRIVFLVGGAYGFHDKVYARANGKLSLSKMTYNHQLIRLIFIEQLYRCFSILNGHPYHND